MKTVNSSVGVFGPFSSIIELHDRLVCDGVEYSFGVIGEYAISEGSPPAITVPPTPTDVEKTIQSNLDAFAQSWGYNDIASACTYINDPCTKFHDEAIALRQWRSDTWLTVETTDAAIKAGTQPYPATMQEALSLLPQPPARPA